MFISQIVFFVILSSSMLIRQSESCAATAPVEMPNPNNCRTCAQNLIMVTQLGVASIPFESDMTDETGMCHVRTFVCVEPNANIELKGGAEVISDDDDGAADDRANLRLTCNAAGTAWVAVNGDTITQVECAVGVIG
ncbi:hypothetical protein PMAYCL1PPCAC_32968 [Pristionchus mayeri]|uniref:C6 domain-containing protein n=1 Tax=Pristionchus mayeri TaxID=1317129 RepID=A0AAN5IDW9_9BILA|nr:hypothetical protein PMAYCL1PPCAC_32968 [Pristionchus mayeri]